MTTKSQVNRLRCQAWGTSVRKNGSPGAGIEYDNSAIRDRTVTFGADYADWKRRIARGNNATTTLTGHDYTWNPGYFSFFQLRTNPPAPTYPGLASTGVVWRNISGQGRNLFPGTTPTGGITSIDSANNRAKAAFVRKVVKARQAMQGGVFLGEIRQAVQLVRNPAQSLRRGMDDYVSSLKKKRKYVKQTPRARRLSTATRIAADTWLEHSFAWSPLISDIKSGAEALARARIDGDKPKTKFVSATGKDVCAGVTSQGSQMTLGTLIIDQDLTSTTTHSVKYYGAVSVHHPSSLNSLLGFTPEDFVPTVWELIPYSFLVDYFSNIGDIIQAACLLRSNLRWVAKGTLHETSTKTTFRARSTDPDFVVSGGGRGPQFSVRDVSRAPYIGSLVPSLDFEIPGFGRKWINMGALLASSRRLQPYHST